MNDKDFLGWIADRLIHMYGESPNTDFIIRLRKMAGQKTYYAFHEDCDTELNNGRCLRCGFVPDMQSIYLKEKS